MEYSTHLENHNQKVQRIAAEIRDKYQSHESLTIEKSSVGHTVPGADRGKDGAKKINVKDLNEIIYIDAEKRIGIAESGATFSNIVKETLKSGLIPMCVSELKDITIGGAVSGCSVESMSYKYGGFHDSCVEYEVITGTGDVLKCTPEENSDVFEMVHGSFGTLGIISLIKFKLIPSKPYVRMDYYTYSSPQDYVNAILQHYDDKDVDLMDGIIHSDLEFTLCIGTFVDEAPYTNTYLWNVFYKSTQKRKTDYIPIYDYFFRYDADCHWSTRNYYLDHPVVRTLMGPILSSFILGSRNILKMSKMPIISKLSSQNHGPDVIVDVFIPVKNFVEFYKWYVKTFDYYPVWIVPYFMKEFYSWVNPKHIEGIENHLFIDFAIYGFRQPDDGKNYYELLEKKLKEVQGVKTLISHNFYDKYTFWEIHNGEIYDKVKAKVDPQNLFRGLFEKMVRG